MSSEWASFINGLATATSITGSLALGRNWAYQSSRTTSQMAMHSFETTYEPQIFKPFTKSHYRENLKELTRMSPPRNIEAHHVFAQQFEESFFIKRGINIHQPNYLTWWERTSHRTNAKQYNSDWKEFIKDNPEATQAQILQQGKELMSEYGIKTNY